MRYIPINPQCLSINRVVKLAPLALMMVLSGCSVGPNYDAPNTTMEDSFLYADNQQQAESDFWWTQFNDPTLDTMVADLQQQNVNLKMAAERIKMAENYKSVVDSFKVPTVNAGAGYFNYQLSKNSSLLGPALNPIGDSSAGVPPQLSDTTLLDNQHDGGFIGVSISWEMDLFGRIDRMSNAAEIRIEQVEVYQSGLTMMMTADLVHNYIQYRGAQERKLLAEANIIDQKRTLELIDKVVESGYGSDLDSAQAKAMLAATAAVIPQLEIAEQVHKHRLAVLLGEPLSQVDVRLAQSHGLPVLEGIIPIGLPSDLLKRRPDIRIAEREMAAINEELAASVANRYPKFFLTGAPGLAASSFDDLFSSDSFGWAGAVGVNWSIYDGGRGKAMVEMNESRFNSAVLSYQHSVNSAFAEVDSALFTYGRSQESQQRVDEVMEATQVALSKAKSLYKAGLIDYISVLDTERQLRSVQDRQLAAQLQTAQVTVSVYKSLGGDWRLDDNEPSDSHNSSDK